MAKLLKSMDRAGLIYLLIVYIVWGSTYLAIRVGVRPGAGFTPFMMGAMRALAGSAILLVWAALSHQPLKPSRADLLTLIGAGVLLWAGGNGLLMVGEQRADSGLAALIIASVPLWATLIGAIVDRAAPSARLIGALLLGSAGIVVLSVPTLRSGVHADTLSVLVMVLGSLCWAGGTVLQARRKVQLSPTVSSGYQMLFGGLGFVIMAFILREPLPHPIPQAWAAWGYLVLFGSLLGFTSYIKALHLLPTHIVTTYSFVNPIIAVILGFVILGERITGWTIAGAVLVLLAVWGVFSAHGHATRAEETPAVME